MNLTNIHPSTQVRSNPSVSMPMTQAPTPVSGQSIPGYGSSFIRNPGVAAPTGAPSHFSPHALPGGQLWR